MADAIVAPLGAEWPTVLRLLVAAALGALVGLERERRDKPAGFRTHLLISVGACLLTELSTRIASSADVPGGFRGDPGRIAAQIVSGIGFLGAGTILHARGNIVVGLTTAASLWVVAAIGMAVGSGQLVLAFATTGVVLIALWLLGRIEHRVQRGRTGDRTIIVEVGQDEASALTDVERVLTDAGVEIRAMDVRRNEGAWIASFTTQVTDERRRRAIERLAGHSAVRRIEAR